MRWSGALEREGRFWGRTHATSRPRGDASPRPPGHATRGRVSRRVSRLPQGVLLWVHFVVLHRVLGACGLVGPCSPGVPRGRGVRTRRAPRPHLRRCARCRRPRSSEQPLHREVLRELRPAASQGRGAAPYTVHMLRHVRTLYPRSSTSSSETISTPLLPPAPSSGAPRGLALLLCGRPLGRALVMERVLRDVDLPAAVGVHDVDLLVALA